VGGSGLVESRILRGAEIDARAANGQTPLHVAAEFGSYGAIAALLKHKADPNIKDKHGRPPVQLCMEYDSALTMLLEAGAEPPDILVATFAGRIDLVKGFLAKDKTLVAAKTQSGETALHFAARLGHIKVVEVLLSNGANVNAADSNKFTPLHYAAIYDKSEIVELLLAHKADRNAKGWDNKTPLDHARERKNEKTIRLLEKGS
jgi:ankyrin repeat protein